MSSKDGQRRLAGYLIRRQADRANCMVNTSGASMCLLNFKH
jgi:hypothetical protein